MEGATELKVTGLTPFFSYTFSVTAENSVSSQDTDTAARTTSVPITTLEGGTLLYSENACELDPCTHKLTGKTLQITFSFLSQNFYRCLCFFTQLK